MNGAKLIIHKYVKGVQKLFQLFLNSLIKKNRKEWWPNSIQNQVFQRDSHRGQEDPCCLPKSGCSLRGL